MKTNFTFVLLCAFLNWQCTVIYCQDLQRSAFSKWAELETQYEQLSGNYSLAATASGVTGKSSESVNFHVKRLGETHFLLETPDSVRCLNSNYSFKLSRPREHGAWFMDSLPQESNVAQQDFSNALNSGFNLTVPRIGLTTIFEFMNSEILEFTEIQSEVDDEISIRFRISNSSIAFPLNERQLMQTGVVHLSRSNDLLPVRFEAEFTLESEVSTMTGSSTGTIDYDSTNFPTRLAYEHKYSGDPPVVLAYLVQGNFKRDSAVSKSNFTLSAYDLPEPNKIYSSTSSFWIFAFIICILLLSLTLFVFRNKRSKA
jgi:hypothetical protein